jgi:chitodextrinase
MKYPSIVWREVGGYVDNLNLKFFYPHWTYITGNNYVCYVLYSGPGSVYYSSQRQSAAQNSNYYYGVASMTDTNWHHYEFYVNFPNGISKFWYDRPGDFTTGLVVNDDYAQGWGNTPDIWYFTFGSQDSEEADVFTRFIDDVEVWDGMPGEVSDTQPPTTPTNLTATAISSSQINLSWTASTDNVGVTGYRIYRCAGSGCTPSTQIATSATNSYQNTGLSANTAYVYRVAAYDAAGNVSAQSSSASATTQASDTTPPTISSVTVSSITSSGATITWTTNEASDSQVEYGLTTSYGSQTILNTSMVTLHSQSLTSLSASTIYHYRVKSKDAAGNLATSADYTFTTQVAPIGNLALGITPTVDSTYSGYSVTSITNGVIDAYGGTATTWASDESSTNPHWVVIDFGQTRTINRTKIYWAWNSNKSQWMTPMQYLIQSWNGSSYVDVVTVTSPTIGSVTEISFSSVTTSRIRIYQPANMGSSSYSTIMWLTELELYGPPDTTPPAPPTGVNVS